MNDRANLISFLIGLALCLTVFAILGATGVARGDQVTLSTAAVVGND
jgi:hypothetical protein